MKQYISYKRTGWWLKNADTGEFIVCPRCGGKSFERSELEYFCVSCYQPTILAEFYCQNCSTPLLLGEHEEVKSDL